MKLDDRVTMDEGRKLCDDATLPRKKSARRVVLLVGIGLVAAAVFLAIFFGTPRAPYEINAALYLKDGQLHYVDWNSATTGPVGERLFEKELSERVLVNQASTVTGWSGVSESGRFLFFPKDPNGAVCTLMARDLSRPEAEPILIDTEVQGNYFISKDDAFVLYEKEQTLFCYRMDNGERKVLVEGVDEGVGGIIHVSEDRKTFVYLKDQSTRLFHDGEDKGLYPLLRLNEKGDLAYYLKDGTLYRLDPKTMRETALATDVGRLHLTYDGDEIYYTGPQREDGSCSLYFYNGKESVLISEEVRDLLTYSLQTPVQVYTAGKEKKAYVCVRDQQYPLEAKDTAAYIGLHPQGHMLFYYDEVDSENYTGTLYRMSLTGEDRGKAELLAENARYSSSFVDGSGDIYYYKVTDDTAQLYINKQLIESNVDMSQTYFFGAVTETQKITGNKFYVTDWDKENEKGTLKLWDGERSVVIAEEAYRFLATSDGRVLYLKNYDSFQGELYQWYQGETQKLADGVGALIPIYRTR